MAVGAALVPLSASAAPRYWDGNGNLAGAGATPSGTWGGASATSSWSTDSTGSSATVASYVSASDVYFSAGTDATGSYTITMGASANANSLNFEEGNIVEISGSNITLSGGSVVVADGVTARMSTNINSSSTGYNKTGGGTLELNASNSYAGTYNFNAGTIKLALGSVGGESGVIPNGSTVVVDGATFELNGRRESWATTGTFTLKSGSVINSDANNTTFDPAAGPQSYLSTGTYNLESGTLGTRIAGSGTLNKNTAGTVQMSGRASFTGTANLNGGRLEVTGYLPASIIHVNNTAVLAGAGSGLDNRNYTNTGVIGKTTVHSGGTIAPGTSDDTTGLLVIRADDTPGGFTLESGGTLEIDLGGNTAGTGYDRLIVQGGLTTATNPVSLAGNLSVDLINGFDPQGGDLFFILTQQLSTTGAGSVGAISGTFAGLANGQEFTVEGQTFKISYFGSATANTFTGGNDVVLQALPVPEPSSLMALSAVAMFLGARRRRRSN
jgi:autotransporter-associated beta strand protein